MTARLALGIPGQPSLARLEKLLAPLVVQGWVQPFPSTEFSDARLAPQAFQHNPDLLFRAPLPARLSANRLDRLFSTRYFIRCCHLITPSSDGKVSPDSNP